MKTTLQVLTEARELLSVPERWTQGAHARMASGAKVSPTHPGACAWCMDGALARIIGRERNSDLEYMRYAKRYGLLALREALHGDVVSIFNDTHTHAEVLAAFDRAIAAEREKEKA